MTDQEGQWPEFGPCTACGADDVACHDREGCCPACRKNTTMHTPKETA